MSQAKEMESVTPVAEEDMKAVLPHVSPQIAAIILLQWHTGMRPNEVATMRGCDLDRGSRIWLYRPQSHKTEHHGKTREIWIGPRPATTDRPHELP